MKNCPNCDSALDPAYKFCPTCGQDVIEEQNLKSLFDQFLKDYFTFDSKIWRTVKPLLTNPGELTAEFLKGRRQQYVPPLRLFIFSSIIFFLSLSLFDSEQVVTADQGQEDFWNRFFENWLPKLFFVLLPIFALILKLFFRKNKSSFLVHFLTSFHFHAAVFIVGILYTLLGALFAGFDLLIVNQFLILGFIIYVLFYLFQSFRNIYQASIWSASLKLFGILILYITILVGLSLLLLLVSYNA